MAISLTVTINSQELIDAWVAYNTQMNALEGRSLTAVQRAKECLLSIVRPRIVDSNVGSRAAQAQAEVEALRAAEVVRVGGLD